MFYLKAIGDHKRFLYLCGVLTLLPINAFASGTPAVLYGVFFILIVHLATGVILTKLNKSIKNAKIAWAIFILTLSITWYVGLNQKGPNFWPTYLGMVLFPACAVLLITIISRKYGRKTDADSK